MLGISAVFLRRYLQEHGVLNKKKINNAWQALKGYRRYFKVFPHIRDGILCSASTKLTAEGADFVIKLYKGEITPEDGKGC